MCYLQMSGNGKYHFSAISIVPHGKPYAFILRLMQRTVLHCRYPYKIFSDCHFDTYFLPVGTVRRSCKMPVLKQIKWTAATPPESLLLYSSVFTPNTLILRWLTVLTRKVTLTLTGILVTQRYEILNYSGISTLIFTPQRTSPCFHSCETESSLV